ncbi:MAG: hypothetical protein QW713_01345 [Sulfolobales archaeon]
MSSDIVNNIVSGLLILYNWLVEFIKQMLANTVFKERPDLADRFSTAITLLVSLTALYILLVFVTAIRKIIGILILIGWVLLIAALALSMI